MRRGRHWRLERVRSRRQLDADARGGLPVVWVSTLKLSAPRATRATSLSLTCEPSGRTFSRILLNSSGVPAARLGDRAVSCCSARLACHRAGRPEICTFCACSAAVTSSGVRAKLFSLFGSSQMRMAY